jgi:hypothetical protein
MTRIKNARSRGLSENEIIWRVFPDTQKVSGPNYFGPSCNKHIFNPHYNMGNVPGIIN